MYFANKKRVSRKHCIATGGATFALYALLYIVSLLPYSAAEMVQSSMVFASKKVATLQVTPVQWVNQQQYYITLPISGGMHGSIYLQAMIAKYINK